MKIIKGCLSILSALFLICVLLFWIYKNNTIERFESLSSQVSMQWEKTAKLVTVKNNQLKSESNISDSLKFYLQDFEKKNNLKYCDSNFINTEFAINRLALKDSLNQINIDELNQNTTVYNSLVRNYNTQRSIFPTVLILRKSGLKDHYKYFEIEYGIENESPKQKSRKTREWQRKIEDSILK
jgi:hypothetical protein